MPVQIRFVPLSSPSPAALSPFADGHVRVGQGRLFIVRRDQIGWLQLDVITSNEQQQQQQEDNKMAAAGGWRGRIRLVEEKGSSSQTNASAASTMCRHMECELRSIGDGAAAGGLPLITLTAHLLISVDELGRRRRRAERDNGKAREKGADQRRTKKEGMNMEDAWAQTEARERSEGQCEEIGVQTMAGDQAAEKRRGGHTEVDQAVEKQRGGQRWTRAASARIMMLIMMALMRRCGAREKEMISGGSVARDRKSGGRGQLIGKVIGRDGGMLGRKIMIERVISSRPNGRDAMVRGSGRDGRGMIGRDRRERGPIGESGRKGIIGTREMETMTNVSIDPRANGAKLRLHPNQIALINNYRAKIAYLSAVHRMIPTQTERKIECVVGREGKKGGKEYVLTRECESERGIWSNKEMAFRQQKQQEDWDKKVRNENDSGIKWAEERGIGGGGSSGLQSVAGSSESEESVKDDTVKGRPTATAEETKGMPKEMNGRARMVPEGMREKVREIAKEMDARGRGMPEVKIGRISRMPEGMDGSRRGMLEVNRRGRDTPDGTIGRVNRMPEGMDGRGRGIMEVKRMGKDPPEGTMGRAIRMPEGIDGRGRSMPEGMTVTMKGKPEVKGRGRGIPEYTTGREMTAPLNGRGKEMPEEMSGRMAQLLHLISERGTVSRTNGRIEEKEMPKRGGGTTPEGMNGGIRTDEKKSSSAIGTSSSSLSDAKKRPMASSSSSPSSSAQSSAKLSSSSHSASATVTPSSTTVVTTSSSAKSSKSSSSHQKSSSKASSVSSSTMKGSSAKTESSIATEISKNGKSISSDRQSNSSVPSERISDQSKQSQSPTTAYLNKLRKQVLDDL